MSSLELVNSIQLLFVLWSLMVALVELYFNYFSSFWLQEVKVGDQLKDSGENVFVGGKNRWK